MRRQLTKTKLTKTGESLIFAENRKSAKGERAWEPVAPNPISVNQRPLAVQKTPFFALPAPFASPSPLRYVAARKM
jgi:hypothetical protein